MSPFRIRTGAIAGLVGAAALVVAGALGGSAPKPADSAATVVTYLLEKRSALRWQAVLFDWLAAAALAAAAVNALASIAILFDADQRVLAPGGVVPSVLALLVSAVWIIAASAVMLSAEG